MGETSEKQKQLEGYIVALYTAILQFMLRARLSFEARAASECPPASLLGDRPNERAMNEINLVLRLFCPMYMFLLNILHKLRPMCFALTAHLLSGREKLSGYGEDAILRSRHNDQPAAARMMVKHAATEGPDNDYAKVSEL